MNDPPGPDIAIPKQSRRKKAAPPVDARAEPPSWRVLALARIVNFALLRRLMGRDRADRLADNLTLRIAEAMPEARVAAAGRDLIEIAFEGASRVAIDETLKKIELGFSHPVEVGDQAHRIEFCCGAVVGEGAPSDEVRMVEQAEHALQQAGLQRRVVVLDAAAAQVSTDRVVLARDLDRAIASDELFLQYQPKMHVRRQEIASIEALVRWKHPVRGLIMPGDFIPLAEENRSIAPLTLWVIRRALADQAALAARGHHLRVFVNIAGILLNDDGFIEEACAIIGAGGGSFGFEVTETSIIHDSESAIANLDALARVGIEIAIDDYGAGLSSLAYLKRLPARELKIDKLFVTHLTTSNRDPLIVRSTIDLAHALEMEVVAEGVESQAALALLSVMGCDMIQGFLISRPVDLDALIAFLDDGGHAQAVDESRAAFNRLAATWKRG